MLLESNSIAQKMLLDSGDKKGIRMLLESNNISHKMFLEHLGKGIRMSLESNNIAPQKCF